MEKQKVYPDICFPPEVICEALEVLTSFIGEKNQAPHTSQMNLDLANGESWYHDIDDEFFADCRRDFQRSHYLKEWFGFGLEITIYTRSTTVSIKACERRQIEASFEVFEKNVERCKLPPVPEKPKPKPIIFIGHGGSEQWKNLKDHLHEKHDYDVEAYEIGARAGHAIRDILEEMLGKTSFAILVMTGEDKTEDGEMRARQNVVHELGLFQGRLGFTKAIILLEDGTEEFSNIHGINQIRYGKANIKETFGEVLATLKREFGGNRS